MITEVDESTHSYTKAISENRFSLLRKVAKLNIFESHLLPKSSGKVRDVFEFEDLLIIITTDRQSAFDRKLADVPFKGRALNQLSAWWFTHTAPLVPSAFVVSPHPNVTIALKCKVFPVEFVVRGFITGTTATSMWTNYANGVRHYCGHILPEGLHKHQQLAEPIITPTTKSTEHDALTSAEDIVVQGWMTQAQWDICANHALTLFNLGQQICAQHGLILVDTKYEFGVDERTGLIRLVDELHTPDSSRFWVAETYEQRMAAGEDPDSVDKDVLRRWYLTHCDPYDTSVGLPEAPVGLVAELSRRYIAVCETITGQKFDFDTPAGPRDIEVAVEGYFSK